MAASDMALLRSKYLIGAWLTCALNRCRCRAQDALMMFGRYYSRGHLLFIVKNDQAAATARGEPFCESISGVIAGGRFGGEISSSA